jgi:signal transduction histidine kinase
MIRQTFKLVVYLLFSLSIGITVTLIMDEFENITVEKKIREALELEIKNAINAFKSSSDNTSAEQAISFLKKFSSTAMKDRIIAVDQAKDNRPDSKEFKFLFTFSENGENVDLYIRNSYLKGELAILDIPELIFGVFTTIVVFVLTVLYAEKRRQALALQQQFETKHAELRKAVEEHEALTLLGRMAATLAHELKTPMATISNLIQVLPSRISDDRFTERFVSLTEHELSRTQQLIDNLLVYGKDIDIKKEEWIESASLIKGLTDKNNIEVSVCPRFSIYGDRFYIELLFENLMRNSIEAGADRVHIEVNIASPEDESAAEILFEDNGRGFPTDCDLDELISPFVTHRSSGAGLGLYLIKKVVLAHGGKIFLYRLENGAGVKILLPKKRVKVK